MPSAQTLDAFVAMVVSGAHADAIATFYTPDSTMQENLDPPRRGRAANVAREQALMKRAKTIHSALEGPVFVHGDHVVIRWHFRFEMNDGSSFAMDELAYQRWDGELIAEERFYYDPAQRAPRSPSS
jgi:ketosteroid isomerase-like protein